uniref:Uncharacterized protein n=1 Tax=Arundo donax TaxID=35708 RepID=A0A0A9BX38_ARUDO
MAPLRSPTPSKIVSKLSVGTQLEPPRMSMATSLRASTMVVVVRVATTTRATTPASVAVVPLLVVSSIIVVSTAAATAILVPAAAATAILVPAAAHTSASTPPTAIRIAAPPATTTSTTTLVLVNASRDELLVFLLRVFHISIKSLLLGLSRRNFIFSWVHQSIIHMLSINLRSMMVNIDLCSLSFLLLILSIDT